MRILMLSCNTGEGHNSTANAIREVLEQRGAECEMIDVLGTCISPAFSKFICNAHARLYKYAPRLWDAGYRVSDKKQLEQDEEDFKMLFDLLRHSAQKLEKLIQEGNEYDEVIAIGPLVMMKFVCAVTKKYGVKTIVSMNPIMIDGTGMCGGCRLTVGGETKFACVDGPDFDGHLVDFDEAMKRSSMYREFEQHAREASCNLLHKEVE